jgi:predicted methyltransferase
MNVRRLANIQCVQVIAMNRAVQLALAVLLASGCTTAAPKAVSATTPLTAADVASGEGRVVRTVQPAPAVLALLAQTDRSAADRALDGPRHAAELLTYLDVREGMSVAQLAAGSGYVTDLFARSIGPRGRVFAENPPSLVAARGLGAAWDARMAQPKEARVVRLDGEIGAPLPSYPLDVVYVGDDLGDLGSDGTKIAAVATTAWYRLAAGGRLVLAEREGDTAGRAAIEGCGFRGVSEARFGDDGTKLVTFVKP